MAAGKVTTGFSKPYVAIYTASGTAVTYSNGQLLARGVDVTISPESSEDNKFYADNVEAETESGKFTGGSLSLTVDGLFGTAKQLIYGLPAADTDGGINYGDDMNIPYVGFGYIARAQSDGEVKYYPTVLYKCRFNLSDDAAATQEENISWQTQSLTATILRDDTANRNWKWEHSAGFATEALAEAALQSKLNI